MSNYKAYTHIERLSSDSCEGILNGHCIVQAKVDSTNACVWHDDSCPEQYRLRCGSRKREVTPNDDNAGFAMWVDESDDDEVNCLREFCHDYPHLIVYGEWMGATKFLGQIKDYTPNAKGKMFIFDVFDTNTNRYLADDVWRPLLAEYGLENYFVPILAELDNPTEEQLMEVAQNNKFLLDNANHAGEGIVIKNYDFINKYGHFVMAKIVLDEYKQAKKISKKTVLSPGEIEKTIVDTYITDAELGKSVAKTVVVCNIDEFDTKNPKCVGMFVNDVWNTLTDECGNWCKRYKNPIVDFAKLKGICQQKARTYIGL